jgi:hypothetical protein
MKRSITIFENDQTVSIYLFDPEKMTLADAATIARVLRDIRGQNAVTRSGGFDAHGHLVSRWSAIVQ